MARALDPLGPAPDASNDYIGAVKVPWQMFLNDSLGDCVCADTAHSLMLRTANVGQIVVPQDSDVLALYEAVGGYDPTQTQPDGNNPTDQGCDETAMCNYLETMGWLGHKADAVGSVDPRNLDHIRWCIQLFGACRLGINVPAWAMDAFGAGQPWGAPPAGADTTIEGGHYVPLVDYRDGTFTCVTWGQPQIVTPAFMALYCEEAHGEVQMDWFTAQGLSPPGFDVAALIGDLSALEAP